MMDSLEILKENNHIDCSNTLLDLISSEINDSENYSLGLSGGSTPKFFYEIFAEKYKPRTKFDNEAYQVVYYQW